MKHLLLVLATWSVALSAHAVTIEFPEEELAKESVLPVFEGGTVAVKSRRVVTKQRFEVGPMAGFVFNEPFFKNMAYGLHAGYHFNEFHKVGINAFMRQENISSDAQQIDSDLAAGGNQIINFSVVPVPKYMATIDYQMTPYYGKLSITKDFVMNLALYIFGGAGVIDTGGEMTWIADIGVGQNLFFTPRFGLRLDFKFLLYEGPNVTSNPNVTSVATSPVDIGAFDKQFNFSPSVMFGAVFLL